MHLKPSSRPLLPRAKGRGVEGMEEPEGKVREGIEEKGRRVKERGKGGKGKGREEVERKDYEEGRNYRVIWSKGKEREGRAREGYTTLWRRR